MIPDDDARLITAMERAMKDAGGTRPSIAELRVTNTARFMLAISQAGDSFIGKRLDCSCLATGTVAWFRAEDGEVYEVTVEPIEHGRNRGLFNRYGEANGK